MTDKDSLVSGGLFIAIGAIYGTTAVMTLPMGTAFSMGPGYFPLVLSGILVAFGIAIVARGLRRRDTSAFGRIRWRPVVMISLAILSFAFFIRSLGLFPTAALATFLSCLAGEDVTIGKAAAVGLSMAVLCTLIFSFGIGLPIPVFGAWIRGFF